MSNGNKANPVTITVNRRGFFGNLVETIKQPVIKIVDYAKGTGNLYRLLVNYGAAKDPNAFHKMLDNDYSQIPPTQSKVVIEPILSPSSSQIYDRVVGIANPVILQELRKIPRVETTRPSYYEEHPDVPRISGGRAFSSVLDAIGMGILSAESDVHKLFLQEMTAALTIRLNNKSDSLYAGNDYKTRFINVIREETQELISTIRAAAESKQKEPCHLDFRFYALKIFLRGFYPEATWENDWINKLSQEIEIVSDMAFKGMVNPYTDIEALRKEANKRMDPFIERIMKEKQGYLRANYVNEATPEILRQIIVSLLFAGGDNIKKYLDHIFVEFGNDKIREKYLQKKLAGEELKTYITEIGRLYTTIYAQPGDALDDFVIEYKGEKIYIKAGDKLHYTTWRANRDEQEWGPFANEFNPEENKKYYDQLNPLATFGSGARACFGKTITMSIIEYLMNEVLTICRWKTFVNGQENSHPTEFNFNNGVQGTIGLIFTLFQEPVLRSTENQCDSNVLDQVPNWRTTAANTDGVPSKCGSFKQPVKRCDNPVEEPATKLEL
ncbi:cytochrome P450 [Legionella hackeliae]|uniref:Cytochrome P450 n=1 Tax=Legionella hackeliae TaxID=449 RepID=A0A0A8USG3_LEGHA|nr:cytochrome P450 [Legionella hackeliae]KTD13767.1 Cytochrome P450 [Legionella hackeliae]CEK10466.1 protein of unknown function [Cytochrome P450 domain] [Legionella hackeliae]STX47202.1 Cytochrome P450 [Legionella hackeliae]